MTDEPTYRPRRGKDGEAAPKLPYSQRLREMMHPDPDRAPGSAPGSPADAPPSVQTSAAVVEPAGQIPVIGSQVASAWKPASGWSLPEIATVLLATVFVSVIEGVLLRSQAVQALAVDAQLLVRGSVVIVYYVILLALVWWLAARRGRSFAAAVGLRSFETRGSLLAVLGYLVIVRLASIAYAVALYVANVRVPGSEVDLTKLFGLSTTGLLVTILIAGAFGPFVEEIVFRAVAYGGFSDLMPDWLAVLLSAILFGVLHFSPYLFVPAVFVGIALAMIYRRSGSLWPAIILHSAYNLSSILLAYSLPYFIKGGL